ncbi:MAG: S8 family serine peptidase [Candidatus Thermoplasmatota archaeon]|nr:S8 family serine peptidase [Candidatus Thermoplasmatota archaeon]
MFSVALILLIASFVFFVTPDSAIVHPSAYDAPSQEQEPVWDATDSWSGMDWDWESMADESGYVRVIFSYSEAASVEGGLADMNQAKADIIRNLDSGRLKEFSSALAGFSGRITLDNLAEFLASPEQGIQVYPDLSVSAMLSESVAQVGATQLWSMRDPSNSLVTGTGMVVAVIDTGVDYMHPDLGGGIGPSYKVLGGFDFVNDDTDPMDDNGHGTHCAGIVAADGGIKGVAPGASILAYKALDASGQGYMSDVIAAIDRAMDPNQDQDLSDRADVISMSLGGPGEADSPVCVAVQNAVAAGIVVVVAAGNEGPSLGTVAAPGVAPEAVTVGAIDKSNNLADFSSRGTVPSLAMKPEVSAPGVNIVSTVPYGGTSISSPTGYYSASGTSMATPHVAGGAALLLQLHPTWTPSQVKSALVTGAYALDASLWSAGAGGMWLPDAASEIVFFDPAMVSYGTAGGPSQPVTVFNSGSSSTAQISSYDWSSLLANGTAGVRVWTNVSSATPSTLSLPSSGSSSVTLQVSIPSTAAPEGYYDGTVRISGGSVDVSLPFGFAVLSKLTVRVTSPTGNYVNDPYGGVWIYSVPDCAVALGKRGGTDKPVPPATFLVPSGTYNVHSIGHHLIYDFSDPYALSGTVTVPRLSDAEIELSMASARSVSLDLATEDGNPIYVKDFRICFRYEGQKNISFHITGCDYSIKGAEVFSLPTSKTIYVSDTDASLAISVSGMSYSSGMWDFMSRNWDHWFEYASGLDTKFIVEATADLQYLMAWEFDGVGASTPSILGLVEGQYSVYVTKYDIPGAIGDLWCNWGTHRAQGGEAAFFARRDTFTSVNPFFTGMTRTTFVQDVFSELYYPGSLFRGFIERSFYTADYSHLLRADTAAEIYVPDRNYLTALPAESSFERIGVGPFYPSLTTFNTNSSLVIVQPLLRDQSGAKVGGMSMPLMDLYRNGQLVGMYQFPEFLARPDAKRIVSLSSPGQYTAEITYSPFPQISNSVHMTLGFSVPATDVNPPRVEGLTMPQVFTPGSSVAMTLYASDDRSLGDVSISWRSSASSSWQSLAVASQGGGAFSAVVPTSSSDGAINILARVADQSGNYIEFTIGNAALAQIPVVFSLSASTTEIGYRNGDASIVLTGQLKDLSGNPLSASGAVPLELMHDGQKIGMILDEYCTSTSHVHNGSIRFEWHFNPADLFSGPSDTAVIDIAFDLGIYQRASQSITLTSVEWSNHAPVITLLSPTNSSLNAAGTLVSLSITDESPLTAEAYLDGASIGPLSSPWQVGTSSWSDGRHSLRIVATDSEGAVATATFEFDIDASDPSVEILYPSAGARVPLGSVLQASVYDAYLDQATYRLDGGAAMPLAAPYSIDMAGWPEGFYTVEITAVDAVGKVTSRSVSFEVASSTVVVQVLSPAGGSVARSGTDIELSVEGAEPTVVRWTEGDAWYDLGSLRSISTIGWSEGTHNIIINATDCLNGYDQIWFTITIDDTSPRIELLSPDDGSFVSNTDTVRVRVVDDNLALANWTLWGVMWRSINPEISISLASSPADGYFTIQMTALDLAGNQATDSFTFAMDTKPPSISLLNLTQGGAIRPGTPLDLEVSDSFLTSVMYSLDSGGTSALAHPYDIDTSGLQNGLHAIAVVAEDAIGQTMTLETSFYIDATLPQVAIGGDTSFVEGSPHTITADASDDFGVGAVTLHCENPDGSYALIPMSWDGTRYVATLPGSALWDGMSVFAVAVDEVGNWADTPQVTLHSVVAPVDNEIGGTDQPSSGDGSDMFGILKLTDFAILASIGAMLVVVVALAMRSRREDSPVELGVQGARRSPEREDKAVPMPPFRPRAAVACAATVIGERGVGGEAVSEKQEQTKQAPPAPAEVRTQQRPRSASLIDAIPDVPVSHQARADGQGDDIDYGELIERELILPGREGSVFKEREDEPPRTDFEVLRKIMEDLGQQVPKKPLR